MASVTLGAGVTPICLASYRLGILTTAFATWHPAMRKGLDLRSEIGEAIQGRWMSYGQWQETIFNGGWHAGAYCVRGRGRQVDAVSRCEAHFLTRGVIAKVLQLKAGGAACTCGAAAGRRTHAPGQRNSAWRVASLRSCRSPTFTSTTIRCTNGVAAGTHIRAVTRTPSPWLRRSRFQTVAATEAAHWGY